MSRSVSHKAGTMIVVVGPSGAGKDSLIEFARDRLSGSQGIGFVRRFITRDAFAGGEAHHAVSVQDFEAMRMAGRFAVSWGAHGLFYGIPADTTRQLAEGMTLIANGSRAALPEFIKAYPDLLVVTITAAPAIIAERLKARGREDEASIAKRLARSQQAWTIECRHLEIDNSGALETAGTQLVTAILQNSPSLTTRNV